MSDRVKIILSSYGGRLPVQAKVNHVEQALQATGLEYELELTAYPQHATELACRAAQQGRSVIVAAGGDGTMNEVVNGLVQAAGNEEPARLGILPLGTGNDLADALKLPRDLSLACERLKAGRTRLIDVCQVNDHYFVNNAAVGLEAMVTMNHRRMRRVKGNVRYILAALKTVLQAQVWQMRLIWDHGDFEGPISVVSVGNSNRTGGSFYMTPGAVPDDGLLDFVYAVGMSRRQLMSLLPKTFSGAHISHELVNYQRTTRLSIHCSPPTPIQADGEIIAEAATTLEFRILPHKLRIIV